VDPMIEAQEEYKKKVLIAERRNVVKREHEKNALKASAETQASSTSFSQECSPSGSGSGSGNERKRRHGSSDGSSESLLESNVDDAKSEDEDVRRPSKLKKRGRPGKKS